MTTYLGQLNNRVEINKRKLASLEEYKEALLNSETQIDLLIERKDDVINLCEMKFYNEEIDNLHTLNTELVHKKEVFVRENKIKKAVFLTLISTFGIKNQQLMDIQNSITIDQLFT